MDLDPTPPHEHFTRLQRRREVMDPNVKLVLDEFTRRFDEHDDKWERRFVDLDCSSHDAAVDRRLSPLDSICANLESLRVAHADVECDDRVTACCRCFE